ncbi:MAG: 4-diphosphocytidyl-2C-methyl-D-erythritol kinase [Dehalococcoidia bacterium]|nr:4-diphosphocytidyl-2C-methyl-D-erythritol kinase [Dehalococcoidia bacterium]
MADVVAILLAAGESRRMGQLKALLPWQGVSLIKHQVASLRAGGVDQVVVVLGHRSDELKSELGDTAGVSWQLNPDYLQGKTTSIKAGLNALGTDQPQALLLLNVDQPRSAGVIWFLLENHLSQGSLITIPTHNGKGGHPIILSPTLLDDLRRIDEESFGIKAVVQRHLDGTRRVEMDSPEVLWDLNTPEEYQRVLEAGA